MPRCKYEVIACFVLHVFVTSVLVFSFHFQSVVGSVDSSDAFMCVRLAAPSGGANGGLYRNMGSTSPIVDPGSPVGAAHLIPATARGMTYIPINLVKCLENSMILSISYNSCAFYILQHIFISCFSVLIGG